MISKLSLILALYRKSQIAIEYAHKFENQHCKVFWVNAANSSRFDQAFRDISEKLRIPGWNNPEIDTRRLVYRWFSDEGNGSWLIILDNADDEDLFFPKPATSTATEASDSPNSLASYIPRSSKGSVLITTRYRNLGMDLADGDTPIEIQAFELKDAEALLKTKAPDDRWDAQDGAILLKSLGYIPLAITQAAAFVRHYDISLRDYSVALNESDLNLQDYLSEELQDPRREIGYPNSIFRTWMLSFNQIRKQSPRAADMLSLMALLDRQGIPKSLIRKDNEGSLEFTTALGTLKAFSLIKAENENETFFMHRLVQLSTQSWLRMQGTEAESQAKALKLLSAKFPDADHKNWKTCEALISHAQAVLKYQYTNKSSLLHRALLQYQMARYDKRQGRYEAAYSSAMSSYDTWMMLVGENSREVLRSIKLVGHITYDLGNYELAEKMNREALELCQHVFRAENPFTLTVLGNLAMAMSQQGKYGVAEDMLRQVLRVIDKIPGKEFKDILWCHHSLSQVLAVQNKFEEAEEMARQALKGSETVQGLKHLDRVHSIRNLAYVLAQSGKYEEAEKIRRQSLEQCEEILGMEHPETLTIL